MPDAKGQDVGLTSEFFSRPGVLAIPSVFHSLGLAPGIIILLVIGGLTTYADWYIGMFKLKHPQVCELGEKTLALFRAADP